MRMESQIVAEFVTLNWIIIPNSYFSTPHNNSFGFVIAWELNIDKRDQPERLVISTAHRNVQVTSLQWDSASLRLFSGDNKGRVTQTNADSRKVCKQDLKPADN